jgi:DNA (cytosine-5)-methyltransferase 1
VTAFAEYILMTPSEHYASEMAAVQEKIYLSKIVIEFLSEENDATYEDLLNKISTTFPPQGMTTSFSEDGLLKHAQWIVDQVISSAPVISCLLQFQIQVESYDSSAEDSDALLIVTPCMRALIKLAGVTLGKRRAISRHGRPRVVKKDKPTFTLATTTPLVRSIFDSIFQGQIEDKVVKTKALRCGICEVLCEISSALACYIAD